MFLLLCVSSAKCGNLSVRLSVTLWHNYKQKQTYDDAFSPNGSPNNLVFEDMQMLFEEI